MSKKIAEKYQTKEICTFTLTKWQKMWTSLVIGVDFTLTVLHCIPYFIMDNFNEHKKGWNN